MLFEYGLTTKQDDFYDITGEVVKAVSESKVKSGVCVVYTAHTSSAISINENEDPDVLVDLLRGFDKLFPKQDGYRHQEGNSAAHLKSSTIGASETLIIEEGKLILGKYQGIYFCEFDAPRDRKFYVKILGE